MIKLRLKFANENAREFDIVEGELLNVALDRALADVQVSKKERGELWLVVVNGYAIDSDMWEKVSLKEKDRVTISPKIRDGDSGQLFKTAAIVAITALVAVYAPELGPYWGSLAVAATSIGASLLLNALIPPPIPNVGDVSGFSGSIDSSQMYNFSGQSNQTKRMGSCPKVYGTHRMFPNIAAIPYTELATSGGSFAQILIGNILFRSKDKGNVSNNIAIKYQTGGTAGAETISVSGTVITITYQGGVSTAAQIKASVDANASAAALVSTTVSGVGTTVQTTTGQTSLAGGSDAGETIQYLYAIYDFGMGTYDISNLQIGDTPISSNSFDDFNFNFVDPAKLVDEDVYDQRLKTDFQYYKSSRQITSLAIALNADGDVNVQNSDANSSGLSQEIVLDFFCPRGLYGFSSNGTLGTRSIDLGVEFALAGTTDWRAFNDLTYVSSFQVVGGQGVEEYHAKQGTTVSEPLTGVYHEGVAFSDLVVGDSYYVKPDQPSLVMEAGVYQISADVFIGNRYLGKVISVDYTTLAPRALVTLDRNITDKHFDIISYFYFASVGGVTTNSYTQYDEIRFVSTGSAAATITGKSTSAVYGSVRFTPKIAGQYQVRVTRIRSYGTYSTTTAADLTWGALTTAYAKSPINTTLRHTFLELKIRATDQLNGNISTLSGLVRSIIPVYDPGTATWSRQPSNNPAWVYADLLTGEVNKRPTTHDKLDLDSLVEWANYCDEVPTPPSGQTFTQKRFTCNFILDYQTTLGGLLAQVGGSAQASLNLINGKYGVLVDKFRATPIQIFTPRNSRDFTSARHYARRPDGVKVSYVDPNTDWNVAELAVYDNGFNSGNASTYDSLTAFACTNNEQAWRFGRYMIAQNRLRQETISLLVDFEYLACTRGDYVQITQDVMRAGGTPMRVKSVSGSDIVTDDSISVDPTVSYGYVYRSSSTGDIVTSTLTPTASNGFTVGGTVPAVGDLIIVGEVGSIVLDCIVKSISPNDDTSAQLTLVEKADAIFDYESTDVLPDYDPQINPLTDTTAKPPAAVTNLAVTDNTWRCSPLRSGHDYYVDLSWDIPAGSVYELFEVWVNDGRGYRSMATTKIKTYRYYVDQDRLDIQHGFKVVAVSATGKKLELIAMTEVLATPTTKPTAPSDVENFNVGITDQTLQLSWDKINDCDSFQYVLRFSPDTEARTWSNSVPLAIVPSALNTFSCQARTGTYFVKALDYAGNESANAAIAITTIPNLFGVTDIQSIDEAPAFLGEVVQANILGGQSIILNERVAGDINSVVYYTQGYYTFAELLDLMDIYTVRLQSLVQADGLKKGELMSDWVELDLVDHLSTVTHADWNVALEYRATTQFDSMADWTALSLVDHLNYGGGEGFTDWRDIPQVGDVTGRIFQFRVRLESLTANVTPRVFDTTVNAYMPDRQESGNDLVSSASLTTTVTYTTAFAGPGTSPNIQVSIDNYQTGDYWTFDAKALDSFSIRFYDKNSLQVSRQFDYVAKGYGHKATAAI